MDNLQEAYLSVYQELDEAAPEKITKPAKSPRLMKDAGPARVHNPSPKKVEEETDLFDYLLEYLVAEGYADTNDNAIAIMANMSEEWREEILDEATIMSVTSPSGKKRNARIRGESPNSIRSRRLAQDIKDWEKTEKRGDEHQRLLSTRKKNIERLNAKPGPDSGDYDAGYHGDDDTSGGERHYSLSRTNQSARKRRASGRQ
jgi:hypothetical protein